MEIKRNGSQPARKGATDSFTGNVSVDPLFQTQEPARISAASVTFESKARTAWHTHPLRQSLMDIRRMMNLVRIPGAWLTLTLFLCGSVFAEESGRVVRLAKLQIDPAHLESYKAALKEEIETSLRVEPGVLTLNAVSEKDNPAHITILEIYADQDAYEAHLESPHFKKYKVTTQNMVKSLELVETVPICLGTKAK
jgi:quinol monooxygenase YgiN